MDKKLLSLTTALCCFTSSVSADNIAVLENTVVQSSKLEQDIRKMPSRVTIINQEQIENQMSVVGSVSELLQN